MATPISRDILNREANARFWATGYRPGHKLDPENPTDKAMMPVWMDIFRKVQAEANAGTLVTTYDHPQVAQNLSDAQVANTVAAAHVEAGAKAADPALAQQHAAAAAVASQVAAQKLSEVAAQQPPTVSRELEQSAAREAAKTPPPPHASAADHIAHEQTQTSKALPREALYRITNERFWNRYEFKRGQKLDLSNAEDLRMSKLWMELFHEIEREAKEGRLILSPPSAVPPQQPPRPLPPPPPQPMPPPPGMQQPWMPPQQPMPWPPQQPMRPWPPQAQRPPQQPMQPMPPMPPQQPMPPWPQPDMQPGMQPGTDPSPEVPPAGGFQPAESAPAPAEPFFTKGTIALAVLGLVGAAGFVYVVTRKSSPPPRSRAPSFAFSRSGRS